MQIRRKQIFFMLKDLLNEVGLTKTITRVLAIAITRVLTITRVLDIIINRVLS